MNKGDDLVGISVKNMLELVRVSAFQIGRIEIKLDYFASSGVRLLKYNKEKKIFGLNHVALGCISTFAKEREIEIQFHVPIAMGPTLKSDRGINIGIRDHHEVALRLFVALEEIFRIYGIGSVITDHLPVVFWKGQQILNVERVVKNANTFMLMLDEKRINEGHKTKIGFENGGEWKKLGGFLGNLIWHFERIFNGVETIKTTFDTGHVRLAKDFDEKIFFELCAPVNMHFHGNGGYVGGFEDFKDDEHLPPTRENVDDYDGYLRLCRENNIPVMLEIADLEKYSDEELINLVNRIKAELNK